MGPRALGFRGLVRGLEVWGLGFRDLGVRA